MLAGPARLAAAGAAKLRLSMPEAAPAWLPEALAATLTPGKAPALLAALAALPVPPLGMTERQRFQAAAAAAAA